MSDDPKALIHGYLDDQLTAEQTQALNDWIKSDPSHAREFATIALLHDQLHHGSRSQLALAEVRSLGGRSRRRRAVPALVVGLALALLGIWAVRRGVDAPVAVLVEARDLVWAVGQPPVAVGTRLGPGGLRSVSGAFKLRFDVGATVVLEGPAAVQILSGMRIRAERGRITARVDEPAQGFVIETPSTLVVDRGTEFGVAIDPSGRTDVVVFQGIVDLARPGATVPPAPIRRLGQGEAMRVGSAGDLSRIIAVERRPGNDDWATGPSAERGAVIRSVRDNIRGLDSSKYYQVVHRGLTEDAPAFVDRTHQWNGLGPEGLPAFLRGADYIMTFNEDKWIEDLAVSVELARAATLYVFYDTRLAPPGWLTGQFQNLGVRVGLDEGPWPGGPPQAVGQGPGTSIDNEFAVWSRAVGPDETIVLGNLGARLAGRGNAMYGIAAVPRPEVAPNPLSRSVRRP